ncbi:MAG: hypothetical protein D6813_02275 [Calditrichaeota bacterium]|nr:MAG: hypothetical protein D6813_02275 [Calditrichota bacterium]
MKKRFHLLQVSFSLLIVTVTLAQDQLDTLLKKMVQYESTVIDIYLEYQKLYYEEKSRTAELHAFEDLLSVYIDQITEMYETIKLTDKKAIVPRDIVARSLIFKALMFLEKAPLNPEFYEKACYEYYKSMDLYKEVDEPPVLYKDLPRVIRVGNRNYYRLIELWHEKSQELNKFAKVNIRFQNFKVTSNFNPQMIDLVKIQSPGNMEHFTYALAVPRIREAFEKVFIRNREVETYIAIPEGSYILKLNNERSDENTVLTLFYVWGNQEYNYILEPLANWIIFYENPKFKRPDFYQFRRNKSFTQSSDIAMLESVTGDGNSTVNDQKDKQTTGKETYVELVNEIIENYLPDSTENLKQIFTTPDEKNTFIQTLSQNIVKYVTTPDYYYRWNLWSAAWEIDKNTLQAIRPELPVSLELLTLTYKTLREL